eukprot:CAMPEP_0169327470 /NCGR_PEP_ID=MMETSP1017-20121227/12069_1 /TAXON_ID=342587 /ORGANISM="Karlodinium micrum, Strain CCMP2283" /LENGTH=1703 /DNA_ID=CAMNT_0009422279 /DNA_START=313 /DNA_END=5422 /DNA_ORIENTATION=+
MCWYTQGDSDGYSSCKLQSGKSGLRVEPMESVDTMHDEEWFEREDDQITRTRSYKNNVHGAGTPCTDNLKETKPCGTNTVNRDCRFNPWNGWSTCSRTCGGGWQTRYRSFVKKLNQGTLCTGETKELQTCSPDACPAPSCNWREWTEWSGCDEDYPTQRMRSRTVMDDQTNACNGTTKEVMGCDASTIQAVDCVLEQWTMWSNCVKYGGKPNCGTGQQHRTRNLKSPPKRNGKCEEVNGLPNVMNEIRGCSLGDCDAGICTYTTWASWSPCSMECGPGTKHRSREVDLGQTKLTDGGCQGAVKEAAACMIKPCLTTDCVWANWQEWGGCTASCGGGTKRRNRQITQNPSNGGRLCDAHMKAEVYHCNMQPCHAGVIDGQWAAWGTWSACTQSCGGAFQKRVREIDTPNSPNGIPVDGYFSQFRNCSHNPPCIPPVDCELNPWTQWSACSASCYGIRHRTRTIRTFANEFGKACEGDDLGILKTVEACNPLPGQAASAMCDATPARDCVLEAWTPWSTCTATCGGGQEYRSRHILSPPSHRGKPCSEALGETRPCQGSYQQPCQRVCHDCLMNEWSLWSDCSGCNGQRYRTRNIQKHPNYCGRQCQPEELRQIEPCAGQCSGYVYCSWTPWTAFEGCTAQCGPATRKKQRSLHLSATEPRLPDGSVSYLFKGMAGGLTCSGTVFTSQTCPYVACPQDCIKTDCVYQQWGSWSVINHETSNAIGLCRRNRQVETIGNCGGVICNGNLIESKECPRPGTLRVDCVMREWGPWSRCHYHGQQSNRVRTIKRLPQNGGTPCAGNTYETKPCLEGGNKFDGMQNCTWQEWFPWSACSASCGVGWKMRHRSNVAPSDGGLPCEGALKELASCDVSDQTACKYGPPGTPCEFSAWQPWGMCLVSGQRTRRREITQYARVGDPPCNGTLEELGSCGDGIDDCKLSPWTAWGTCRSADGEDVGTCGKGQTRRHRQIDVYPSAAGAPCPKHLQEVKGCGSNSACPDSDCKLSAWSSWAGITGSATCGYSQYKRVRTIINERTQGDSMGCNDPTEEYTSQKLADCPVCVWPQWSAWSACSAGGGTSTDCKSSEKMRTRTKPVGVACNGVQATEEYQQCNASVPCSGCQDATWAQWSAWGTCHTWVTGATCGNGYQSRTRVLATQSNHCGAGATGPTQEVQPCSLGTCANQNDCEWGEWSTWTACSKTCHGTTERHRAVKTQPKGDGAVCKGAMSQIFPCNPGWSTDDPATGSRLPNNINGCAAGAIKKHCIMSAWSAWSCSATCGESQGIRKRSVVQYQEHQGDPCLGNLEELQTCSVTACADQPKSCQVDDWGPWSGCDACKGQMYRARHFTGGDPAGKACPATSTKETAACGSARNCGSNSHYCSWEPWGQWSPCDAAKCESGKQTRERIVSIKVARRRISMGEQPSLSAVPGQKAKYVRSPQQCVTGHNLGQLLSGKSVEECAALCEADARCVAFESGFDYGGSGASVEGDCQMKTTCNTAGCDGAHENLDVYIKVGYKKIAASCVNQNNIDNLKYSNKTVDECQRLCDATRGCVAIEYGVAYGGSGAFKPGDCLLNDASDPTGCDGHEQNLDLYVKARCYSTNSSSSSSEVCERSKCLENGGLDEDCCAPPSSASCVDGYRYSQGEVCAGAWHVGGSDFFRTCCTLAPVKVQASVLYEQEVARRPEAMHHVNMAVAFGAGVVLFGVGAFAW